MNTIQKKKVISYTSPVIHHKVSVSSCHTPNEIKNNTIRHYKTETASSALTIRRISVPKKIAPSKDYLNKLINSITEKQASNSKTTKQKQESINLYNNNYSKQIGLYGKFHYFTIPRHSVRAIWNGNRLCMTTLVPFDCIPIWFTKPLPIGIALDGYITISPLSCEDDECVSTYDALLKELLFEESSIDLWKKYASKIEYHVFDHLVVNTIYVNRYKQLQNLELRNFKKSALGSHVKLCNFHESPVNDVFREFYKIAQEFLKLNCNERLYLIRSDSYLQSKSESKRDFYELSNQYSGKAEIIGLHEGINCNYGKLGKFQCRARCNGRNGLFYCGKEIPDEIRKCYCFEATKLIQIISSSKYNKKDLPQIGDTLLWVSTELLENGLPRDAIFVGFEKKLQ